jgi:peroxiredoxin
MPYRLVHYADHKTANSLGLLVDAVRLSERPHAAIVVIVVLPEHELAKARHTPGIIYAAEDGTRAWAQAFGVTTSERPFTLLALAGPKRGVVWQQEGQLDSRKLAAVLAKYLAPTGPIEQSVLGLNVRIGRPGPNFLLPFPTGQLTTLRKIAGRGPMNLVFYKDSLKVSVQAVLDLQKTTGKRGGQGPFLVAISDGGTSEQTKKTAAENGLTAIVVPDPQRNISAAYGVDSWPITLYLDKAGLVRNIRYGRFAAEPGASPSGSKAATS